jgi:hypothetical protein
MPGRPLIGITDVAKILGVTRTRADQLSRTSGWPPTVESVIPVDDVTVALLRAGLEAAGGETSANSGELVSIFVDRASPLPHTPRLWRLSAVLEWCEEQDRDVNLDALPPDMGDE